MKFVQTLEKSPSNTLTQITKHSEKVLVWHLFHYLIFKIKLLEYSEGHPAHIVTACI